MVTTATIIGVIGALLGIGMIANGLRMMYQALKRPVDTPDEQSPESSEDEVQQPEE